MFVRGPLYQCKGQAETSENGKRTANAALNHLKNPVCLEIIVIIASIEFTTKEICDAAHPDRFRLSYVVCRLLSEGDANESMARCPSSVFLHCDSSVHDWRLGTGSRKHISGIALADDRSVSWRTDSRCCWRSRPAQRLLCRPGKWRCLEVR